MANEQDAGAVCSAAAREVARDVDGDAARDAVRAVVRDGPGRCARGAERGSARVALACAVAAIVCAVFAWGLPALTGGEPDPLLIYRRHRDHRDPVVRRRCVQALAPLGGPEVVATLLSAATDVDHSVRRAAQRLVLRPWETALEREELVRVALARRTRDDVRGLAVQALGVTGKEAVPQILTLLAADAPAVRELAIEAAVEAGAQPALPVLHELLAGRESEVRAAACAAVAALRPDDAADVAIAVLAGDRAAAPRVAALTVLEIHMKESALDQCVRALSDRSWSVRVAAARALASVFDLADRDASGTAVRALVKALDAEPRQRVAFALSDALFTLTGIDFGPEPERWNAWLAETGGEFAPPEKEPRRGAHRGGTGADLLDVPVESDHVTFVIDASHSMNDPLTVQNDEGKSDDDGEGAGDGRTGRRGRRGDGDARRGRGRRKEKPKQDRRSKKEALVAAFRRVLSRLPKSARINVIAFGTEVHPMKKELFPGTVGGRAAAVRFLEKLPPSGRTNIFDALTAALSDPDCDTIVLVTDGAPTEGRERTRTGILAGLERLNRYRLARVHTVEIGAANTGKRWRGFMADIAEATGGHHLAR